MIKKSDESFNLDFEMNDREKIRKLFWLFQSSSIKGWVEGPIFFFCKIYSLGSKISVVGFIFSFQKL
jgi:hypothetical protein